ncbi:MAG TPA: aminopeptidase N, partial [Stellaceae bacterium]|nr:aminopeptidase N [Stellaceae bacterium]
MLDISADVGPPRPVRLDEYRPPDFLIDTVDLVFELGDSDTRVKSHLRIRRNPESSEHSTALQLDGEELALVSLALDGEPLDPNRYELPAEEGLILADVPDAFSLDVEARISPASNTALSGLYMSGGNFCTQCEPEGFRRITYFVDRPDVMARYATTIIADKARFPVLLSNG